MLWGGAASASQRIAGFGSVSAYRAVVLCWHWAESLGGGPSKLLSPL